ncbi:ribonuclease HII [Antarcticibacterium flavum]|uniref:Ribonuclease HII n=1 Tax=Antarcticibacterium flavum TaxID=2058175 RepID=A0A5B7X2C0_9FLAO|nr:MULTISPECIES: ribonuclease HII [Antarcticibacterium]MCM4161035.1 ribonuclease HII [Antarcticibacterium sp. W02-3]QCY69245.1 ribonuclease HII [Antarcticibacterium flavum]
MLANSFLKDKLECGTDEAGRGCLAGPVTAAAVILPPRFRNAILNDSKILKISQRLILRDIIEKKAICFSVAHLDNNKVDEINILNASILAMHHCIENLSIRPQHILVDGNRFKPYPQIPHLCMIKGDAKYMNIAAASILAKTYRDAYMEEIHVEYPMYNWRKNKGYPTREHREAIRKYGVTKYHRKSFRLLPEQLELAL